MGNKLFFKFNTVIDILGVDIDDSYSYRWYKYSFFGL